MNLDIARLKNARVLVIGDVMLDQYWSGDTARISPEAPVPVVHVKEHQDKPGGAANVALNIASLGARVVLLGICGQDDAGAKLQKLLQASAVETDLLVDAQARTICKLRILSRHQQLIRLDQENGFAIELQPQLVKKYKIALADIDAVIISDYNKGTVSDNLENLITLAKQAGKTIFIDPKNPQADVYRHATMLTPNEAEFALMAGSWSSEQELSDRVRNFLAEYQLQALLVTRSEKGMSLFEQGDQVTHIPAFVREVFDVTGAGDTVIAILAAAVAVGFSNAQAARLANLAASLVVGRLGAANLSLEDLQQADFRSRDHQVSAGVVTEQDLLLAVGIAKHAGETLVMTNGCFDILHAGHVDYLQRAAAMGDRLVVAVNDDASVGKLKGAGRPINPLAQRMTVLSALSCVDWVVAFSEETPARLIAEVAPDYLIKGGDYQPKNIAGYESVTTNGGEVLVIPLVPGISTTEIAKRLGNPHYES